MAKVKYYYAPETLSYKPVEYPRTLRISNFLVFLISSFLFGLFILFGLLTTDFLSTPEELLLKRELRNYEFQFDLVSKRLGEIENVISNIEERDNELYRNYFEASPVSDEQRKAGFGGVNRYKSLEGYGNSEQIIETTKKLDILSRRIVVQSKSLDEIRLLAEKKEELLASIPSIQPIRNEDLKRMASGYGWRIDPFTKTRKRHYGMDFSASRGTPIYAPGNGVVKRADSRSSGYGRHIRIDHGFGYVTVYAHLNKYNVKRGQKVKRGDIIGYVGSTGRSVAPHLHYEIIKDGKKINPLNFYIGNLTSDEYNAILIQASQENLSLDEIFTMKNILNEKKYYSIGEVAEFLNVNTSLIRFWEKEFKQISPKKKKSGVRKFTKPDVEILQFIYSLLKEKKMTIDGAKRHLQKSQNKDKVLISIRNKLEEVKSELLFLRDNV